MKRGLLGFIIAAPFLFQNVAHPAEVSVGADVSNAYVWRGITFNDEGVIQPYVDIAHPSGLGFNVWGNFDIGDFGGTLESGEFSEVDLTLSYQFPIKAFDLSIGFIEYLFPNTGSSSTREIYLSGGVGLFENLSGAIATYYDVGRVHGFYGNASLSYAIPVDDKLSFDLGAALGAADKEFAATAGGKNGGLFDYNLSLTGSYSMAKSVSLGAFLKYTNSADKDVLPKQVTDVYGGVSISYSF